MTEPAGIVWQSTGQILLSIYEQRDDGITGVALNPVEDVQVVPVLGETVTVTFQVTAIRSEERA